MSTEKKVVLLGATGSIGHSTLEVLRELPDTLTLHGIAGHTRYRELAAIAREFNVPRVVVTDDTSWERGRKDAEFPPATKSGCGEDALLELVTAPEVDIVLVASSGTSALRPTLAAIEAGKTIALANKELLVLAGRFITEAARKHKVALLPVDSEHNALFQCLEGRRPEDVARLVLTASGGAFLDRPAEDLVRVAPEDALRHPNWSMGPKITVDSATMANKGLEMIEAHWLFGMPSRQIEVVLHRQSVIHSLVELVDGSILAQMSPPSMTFAIHHVLTYPHRTPSRRPTLDFKLAHRFDLEPVPLERYPCLSLARQALEEGGVAPAIFNTANQAAVEAFLEGKLGFLEIPPLIEKTLDRFDNFEPDDLQDVLNVEEHVRRETNERIENNAWKTTS